MKVVIDECLDVRLRLQFPEHECVTVQYLRAKGTQDGSLLDLITSSFDVLITRDSSMRHQQNPQRHPRFSRIFITTGDGSIEDTLPLVPTIQSALRKIKPGQTICVP